MAKLAPEIVEAIVIEHGRRAFLERLSDPHWFQAFGCVLGFDWHSSGVTTTVCGALKEGLAPRAADLGLYVAGGKGKTSRQTPNELQDFGARLGMDGDRLAYNSRMAAKVDSAAVQDGFDIYHHSFFLSSDGEWAVVQPRASALRTVARTAIPIRSTEQCTTTRWSGFATPFPRLASVGANSSTRSSAWQGGNSRSSARPRYRTFHPFTGPPLKNAPGVITPSFLNTIPFLSTNRTSRKASMLCSGLPGTAMRSANIPTLIGPRVVSV